MLTDTAPEIAQLQRKLWGRLPIAERLQNIASLTRSVRSLTRHGILRRHPELNAQQINAVFSRRVYGNTFQNLCLDSAMNEIEIPAALLTMIRACEKLGLKYRIGGSLAGSLYGEPRATNDADVVIDLKPGDAAPFVNEIQADYAIYADSLQKAIARERSINALHFETVFKIDIFPLKSREYDQQAHQRRTMVPIERDGQTYDLAFATAEDMLIAKLEWYRKGNEVSEQQWRDILGILRAETGFLDFDYLEKWTRELKLHDLFERAQREAGSEADSGEIGDD